MFKIKNPNVIIQNGSGDGTGENKEDMLQARINATKSCSYLFYHYPGMKIDYISDLDTSEVTDMSYMCADAQQLISFPKLSTSKVKDATKMFQGCINLTTVYFDFSNSPTTSLMFDYCTNLINVELVNIKKSLVIGTGSWGTLIKKDCLINIVKELINVDSDQTLNMGSTNISKISNIYVKFVNPLQTTIPYGEKGEVEVCESSDEGAMLLQDYASLKKWLLA